MSQPKLELPSGQTSVSAKMINPVNFGPAILKRFMAPDVPGLEIFPTSPSLSFLIEHPSGRKLVWDLGIRKDYANYAPTIAGYIPTTGYKIEVSKSVADILEENGIAAKEIEAVIWSHWHWDHIGDPSTFPPTTDLVVGPGFKDAMLPGAPANPDSPLLESDYTGRNLREIAFNGTDAQHLKIGGFPAFDYFGDGLELPSGQTSVSVKMINPVNFGPAMLKRFMAPDVPGLETFPTSPSLSFLVEHPSGRKLVWDLGIRKDYANYAPTIAGYIPTTGYKIEVIKSVAEILEENGMAAKEIEAVIWR
ncbi:Cytochrome monooxygenase mpaDE like protein [Verticillium longisporum]|nr:Cytochrome monooxygenase mpaDE like protein [Verticillium longisporum]